MIAITLRNRTQASHQSISIMIIIIIIITIIIIIIMIIITLIIVIAIISIIIIISSSSSIIMFNSATRPPLNLTLRCRRLASKPCTVDFRNLIVFLLGRDPGTLKSDIVSKKHIYN